MSDHFTTEFGHRIDFVPEYFERNRHYADHVVRYPVHQKMGVAQDQMPPNAVLTEWVQVSALLQFMRKNGIRLDYDTSIDLGGAEGSAARLYRAAGISRNVASIDLVDYSATVNEKYFRQFVQLARNPQTIPDHLRRVVSKAKAAWGFADTPDFADGLLTHFPQQPSLECDYHFDLLNTPGTYDLISATACFDHFAPETILRKVSSLLRPGGIFIGMVQMWWYPINTSGILGRFPYAAQRLSFADLERYFTAFHPEFLVHLPERFAYFQRGDRPTIGDWIATGEACGLQTLATERVCPRIHKFGIDQPETIFSGMCKEAEVLRDIHTLKPDVVREDLYASHIMIAMTPR